MKNNDKASIAAIAKRADIFLGASIILASNTWFAFDNLFNTVLHIGMFILIIYFTYNIGVAQYKIIKFLDLTEKNYEKATLKIIVNIALLIASLLVSFLVVNNRESHSYTISLWLFVPLIISLPLFITHAKVTKPTNDEE